MFANESNGLIIAQFFARTNASGKMVTMKHFLLFAFFFRSQSTSLAGRALADAFDKDNSRILADPGFVMAILAYAPADLEQPLPRQAR